MRKILPPAPSPLLTTVAYQPQPVVVGANDKRQPADDVEAPSDDRGAGQAQDEAQSVVGQDDFVPEEVDQDSGKQELVEGGEIAKDAGAGEDQTQAVWTDRPRRERKPNVKYSQDIYDLSAVSVTRSDGDLEDWAMKERKV